MPEIISFGIGAVLGTAIGIALMLIRLAGVLHERRIKDIEFDVGIRFFRERSECVFDLQKEFWKLDNRYIELLSEVVKWHERLNDLAIKIRREMDNGAVVETFQTAQQYLALRDTEGEEEDEDEDEEEEDYDEDEDE